MALLCTVLWGATANGGGDGMKKSRKTRYKLPKYSKSTILERMDDLEAPFEMRLNTTISKIIKDYVSNGRRGTEIILGRRAIFFPIFEQYLQEKGLPEELKYLAVIESGLDPTAVSKVGAAGLWQFMPKTGRKYGLVIDDYRDERFDIHKSTVAAVDYLDYLYNRFDDWTLAIAAYNCGPGRVSKEIRKAGTRDFWKLKKKLPKETQRYVQKFLAVNYVMSYYLFYDLHPDYPDYNLQLTALTKVYKRRSFKQLALETGVDVEIIRRLNPAYKKELVPPVRQGNLLMLPKIGRQDDYQLLQVYR
ncbi:MAG: lytic transglycosylase domain-containing protein [Bacteroidota bacterium]